MCAAAPAAPAPAKAGLFDDEPDPLDSAFETSITDSAPPAPAPAAAPPVAAPTAVEPPKPAPAPAPTPPAPAPTPAPTKPAPTKPAPAKTKNATAAAAEDDGGDKNKDVHAAMGMKRLIPLIQKLQDVLGIVGKLNLGQVQGATWAHSDGAAGPTDCSPLTLQGPRGSQGAHTVRVSPECSRSQVVDLPQIVVVGSQSAGKSSVGACAPRQQGEAGAAC